MQSTQNKKEIIIFAIVDFTFEPYVFGLFQMVFELCNCRSSGSRNHWHNKTHCDWNELMVPFEHGEKKRTYTLFVFIVAVKIDTCVYIAKHCVLCALHRFNWIGWKKIGCNNVICDFTFYQHDTLMKRSYFFSFIFFSLDKHMHQAHTIFVFFSGDFWFLSYFSIEIIILPPVAYNTLQYIECEFWISM